MARADLNTVLTAYAALLRQVGVQEDAAIITLLTEKLAPERSLLAAVDKSKQIIDDSGVRKDKITARAYLLVQNLRAVFKTAAKKDVLADLGRLALFLERHQSMPFATLLAKVTSATPPKAKPLPVETIVSDYAERLSKEYGLDGFEDLLATVLQDRRVKKTELIQIARKLGHDVSPRASKATIANKILRRHKDLATFKLKQKAMAGRSAA